MLEGRIHVSCNDIRGAALPVLLHRVLANLTADSSGLNTQKIIDRLLTEVKESGEAAYTPAPA